MPLIAYPTSLPPPSAYPFARRESRAVPQGAGNEPPRARSRDAIVDADTVRWRYSPAEMAAWRAWFEDTLLNGQLWFAATLPGRGGWLPRVARYIGEQLQITHLGAGYWEVSCRLELRGQSASPTVPSMYRYWRLTGFENTGGLHTCQLSAAYLFTGAEGSYERIDVEAVLVISGETALISGGEAELSDGSFGTYAAWTDNAWSGVEITWDFGSFGFEGVTAVQLGKGPNSDGFPTAVRVERGDGSTWVQVATIDPGNPGANAGSAILAL